uniref:Uncharacterized protein MANES_18G125100 n=1 Tax=Rhizophora mucronata TaxID=61149 RepID=A0A2P2MYA1_RHIMU
MHRASVPVCQLLMFLVVLYIRVGANERAEKEESTDPVLGNLVVNLVWKVIPEPLHHLLLERRQSVHHRLHSHWLLPHRYPLDSFLLPR